MGLQGADGADWQTGAGGEEDVMDLGEVGKHPGAGVERGLDNAEAAPFARAAEGKSDVGEVLKGGFQAVELGLRRTGVDVDHDRAAVLRPVPGQLRRAVQGGVAEHDDAQGGVWGGHAQFPFDIRPSTSSWRQLTYFSLQLHQRSRSRAMPSR